MLEDNQRLPKNGFTVIGSPSHDLQAVASSSWSASNAESLC